MINIGKIIKFNRYKNLKLIYHIPIGEPFIDVVFYDEDKNPIAVLLRENNIFRCVCKDKNYIKRLEKFYIHIDIFEIKNIDEIFDLSDLYAYPPK